jgi:hypothetical protein
MSDVMAAPPAADAQAAPPEEEGEPFLVAAASPASEPAVALSLVALESGASDAAAAVLGASPFRRSPLESVSPVTTAGMTDSPTTVREGTVADRIDVALSPGFEDLGVVRELLQDIQVQKVSHPGIRSLSYKERSLSYDWEAQKSQDMEAAAQPTTLGNEFVFVLGPGGGDCGSTTSSEDEFDTAATPVANKKEADEEGKKNRRKKLQLRVSVPPRQGSIISLRSPAGGGAVRRRSIILSSLSGTGLGRRGAVVPSSGGLSSPHRAIVVQPGGGGRRTSISVQTEVFATYLEQEANESGQLRSEWWLVLVLAMPLALGKLADEVSMIGLNAIWGRMGTTALAAGNYGMSWMNLAIVVVCELAPLRQHCLSAMSSLSPPRCPAALSHRPSARPASLRLQFLPPASSSSRR